MSRRSAWALGLLLVVLVGAAGTAGGFVVGYKWPIETVEEWLASDAPPTRFGWSVFAESDLPRYEMGKVRIDDEIFLFGGFYNVETQASARVEVLDLVTGEFSRREDMPVALTHAHPVVVRDTVWVVGGFVGDHPGPVTDEVWRYAPADDRWLEGPSLPAPRAGGVLAARGDTLHYFGGYMPDRNTDSGDHWTLVVGDTTWRPAPPFPMPRGHVSGAVLDDRIYAISGNIGHDPVPVDIPDVRVYDAATRSWSEAPPAPFSISHTEPSTVVYDGGILTVGGRARDSGWPNLDDVLYFDPELGRWLHTGRTPMTMLGAVAAVRNDTLIAGLGAATGNDPANPYLWQRPLRDAWWRARPMPRPLGEVAAGVIDGTLFVVGEGANETLAYDLASGRWAPPGRYADRPGWGHHHGAEVWNGELILLGGLGQFSSGRVQRFDPVENRWRLGPAMPFPAGSSASARIGDRIYVAGGIVGDTTTSQAAVLDLTAMTWEALPPMPRPRNHAASATDGEKLYVFGGRGPGSGDANVVANGYDDVQIYDPANGTWTVSDGSAGAPPPLPQARGGMGKAVYLDGEFWVIGGETLDGPGATATDTYDRVDIYDPVSMTWRRGPDLPTARHGIFPVVDAGRIVVAGGGTESGYSFSDVVEVIWPSD